MFPLYSSDAFIVKVYYLVFRFGTRHSCLTQSESNLSFSGTRPRRRGGAPRPIFKDRFVAVNPVTPAFVRAASRLSPAAGSTGSPRDTAEAQRMHKTESFCYHTKI